VRETEDPIRTENTELRRLLEKHQWAGLTPVSSVGSASLSVAVIVRAAPSHARRTVSIQALDPIL